MHPPTAQPIMNPHAMQPCTYYSFTLDEPCVHVLVYHLYSTCLYLPFVENLDVGLMNMNRADASQVSK